MKEKIRLQTETVAAKGGCANADCMRTSCVAFRGLYWPHVQTRKKIYEQKQGVLLGNSAPLQGLPQPSIGGAVKHFTAIYFPSIGSLQMRRIVMKIIDVNRHEISPPDCIPMKRNRRRPGLSILSGKLVEQY